MSQNSRALVSLSGGLDSTVSLYWALKNYDEIFAVFFDYGQKALESERLSVEAICKKLKVELLKVSLSFLNDFSNSSLNNLEKNLPKDIDLNSKEQTKSSSASVWVSNRNGLFINAAACLLESKGGGELILGFNKEEAETFPDNSKSFLEATNKALYFSTQEKVKLFSPTVDMSKKEIYELGIELGFESSEIWSCYESGERPCGKCESCLRFDRAKKEVEG